MELNKDQHVDVGKQKGNRSYIKKEIKKWLYTTIVVVLIVVFVRQFFFTTYIVHGGSMMPTISDGNRVVVNKIGYELGEPDRFDLVIFRADEHTDYFKRVIGLPGEHIQYKNDVLYVNGEPIEEAFLDRYRDNYPGLFTYNFTLEEVTGYEEIPDGMVFVLGDNRVNSVDSRQIGLVELDRIVGEVNYTYWPPKHMRMFK